MIVFSQVNNDGVKCAPRRTPWWTLCQIRTTGELYIGYRRSICEINVKVLSPYRAPYQPVTNANGNDNASSLTYWDRDKMASVLASPDVNVNLLATGRYQCYCRHLIFRLILVICRRDISCKIVLSRLSLDLIDDGSRLVQVMAWSRRAKIIIWSNVDSDLCNHMASLVHNALIHCGPVTPYGLLLKQCWLVISEVLRHSLEGNFTGNVHDIYPWYDFENQ